MRIAASFVVDFAMSALLKKLVCTSKATWLSTRSSRPSRLLYDINNLNVKKNVKLSNPTSKPPKHISASTAFSTHLKVKCHKVNGYQSLTKNHCRL